MAWFPAVPKGLLGPEAALFAATVRTPDDDPALGQDEVVAWVAALAGCEASLLRVPGVVVLGVPETHTLDGDSWQAAAAVAVVSFLLGAAPRVPAVVSGALGPRGPIPTFAKVGGEDAKRAAASREAGHATVRFASKTVDASTWFAEWFGEDWQRRLQASVSVSPDALGRRAMRLYDQGRQNEADPLAGAAVGGGATGVARAQALWVLGSNALHRGQASEGLERLLEASKLLLAAPEGVEGAGPVGHARLQASVGIALVDHGAAEEAESVLIATRRQLLNCGREIRATPEWRRAVVHVTGSLHRALVLSGHSDAALALLTDTQLGAGLVASEEARTWGDVAEVHRRKGRLEEAGKALDRAWCSLVEVQEGELHRTRRFLELYRVRAGLSEPPDVVGPACWQAWPDLGFTLERLLREPDHRIAAWVCEPGNEPSRAVHGMLLAGMGARQMLRHGRVPGWLENVVTPLLQVETVDDGVREVLKDLLGGEPEAWIARCPY